MSGKKTRIKNAMPPKGHRARQKAPVPTVIDSERFVDWIGLDVSIQGGLYRTSEDRDGPQEFIHDFRCTITGSGPEIDDAEIGKITGQIARIAHANECGFGPHAVLDEYARSLEYYALFRPENDALIAKVAAIVDFDFCDRLIMIHRAKIEQNFRGQDLGLLAVYSLIETIAAGDTGQLIALTPCPLQYQDGVNDENRDQFAADMAKLEQYWARLGFKKATADLWVMGRALKAPAPEEFMRQFVTAEAQNV